MTSPLGLWQAAWFRAASSRCQQRGSCPFLHARISRTPLFDQVVIQLLGQSQRFADLQQAMFQVRADGSPPTHSSSCSATTTIFGKLLLLWFSARVRSAAVICASSAGDAPPRALPVEPPVTYSLVSTQKPPRANGFNTIPSASSLSVTWFMDLVVISGGYPLEMLSLYANEVVANDHPAGYLFKHGGHPRVGTCPYGN